jgi:uncharacterized membrane protein YkgB
MTGLQITSVGVGRLLLAIVFIIFGIGKLAGTPEMEYARELPSWLAWSQTRGALLAMAAIEMLIGVLVLSRLWRKALHAVFGLAVLLFAYLCTLSFVGRVNDCGCLGRVAIPMLAHIFIVIGIMILAFGCTLGSDGSAKDDGAPVAR